MIYDIFLQAFLIPLLVSAQSFSPQDNTFRPTSGEQILANVTYFIQWTFVLPFPSCYGIDFSMADKNPPGYTRGFSVMSRKYINKFGALLSSLKFVAFYS